MKNSKIVQFIYKRVVYLLIKFKEEQQQALDTTGFNFYQETWGSLGAQKVTNGVILKSGQTS